MFLMINRLLVLTCLLMVVQAQVVRGGLTYYVATDGNDQWSGTRPTPRADRSDGPFATLVRARDVVRTAKADAGQGAVEILIRGGRYSLPDGLAFTEADSGSEQSPIIYRRFEYEVPILIGGREISGWKPWKGEIQQADIAAQGFQGKTFSLLLLNGERQHLARYPNFVPENPYGGGWAYAAGKRIPMYQDVPDESKRNFEVEPQDVRQWAHPEQVEVFVFPRYNWWNNIVRIAEFDPASRAITLTKDCSYPVRPGDRYYFQNALEELDAPGEWFHDAEAGVLYFWPPEPLSDQPLSSHSVTAPITRTILSLNKTSHVRFLGLTLECAQGTAVTLANAEDCQIAGCEIRSVGDYSGSGVTISGGHRNTVFGCDIHHIGSSGIGLSGGNRVSLEPAENVAENNYIHHIGQIYKQGVGLSMTGVGLRAAHNLIHDGPRMGIMFSGNHIMIEFNHIRHMNLETEDTGAIYTGGRDWISSRGSVIRHNYLHDMLGYGKDASGKWVSPHFAWGVYLDDNTGGVDVIGNIVARCSRAGIHLHNGRDNLIENNLFLENRLYQVQYSGWKENNRMWTNHFPTMVKGYESVIGSPAWKNMRHMDLHPKDAILPDGTIMSQNVFRKNVVAWKDPRAKLFGMRNVSYPDNPFDHNLYWHFNQEIDTGVHLFGPPVTGNLAPNPGFEAGPVNKLPESWKWQIHPAAAQAMAVTDHPAAGQRCLRINAAFDDSKPRDNYPIIVSTLQPLTPGKAYRLRARFRGTSEQGKAQLMLQSYVAKAYFWASPPAQVNLTPEWQPVETTFRIPGPGENGYHEQMRDFVIRLDFKEKSGALFVDDVSLEEVSQLSSWQSWQQLGNDEHSLIADPLFEDYAADDFRLKENSPAAAIGFETIPVDKIGPYADPLRATWPIAEEIGAREQPLITD